MSERNVDILTVRHNSLIYYYVSYSTISATSYGKGMYSAGGADSSVGYAVSSGDLVLQTVTCTLVVY